MILCDIDGVLVDSHDAIYHCYRIAFDLRNTRVSTMYSFSMEDFDRVFWGKEYNAERMARELGISVEFLERVRTLRLELDLPKIYLPHVNHPLNRLLYTSEDEVVLVTSGSKVATMNKMQALGMQDVEFRLVSREMKTSFQFWDTFPPSIVIDDDLEVLQAAQAMGHQTLHVYFKSSARS